MYNTKACTVGGRGLPQQGVFLPFFNCIFPTKMGLSNWFTMGSLPVLGDNSQALVSGLSYLQVDHGITILYQLFRPCTSRDIACLSW